MREAAKTILNYIKDYYPDRMYLLVFLFALCYIFITNKKLRNKLIVPMLVIMLVVINPVLYKLVFRKLIYWRFFWIFSDVLIISYVITDLVRKSDKVWVKIWISCFCAAVIALSGVNIFRSGVFVKAQNKEHLDAHTKAVCDAMLAISDEPKCIVPLELTWEARQYNGDIQMMYGRNADGYINRVDPACDLVQESIAAGVGFDYVFTMAGMHGYPFVVTLAWKQPEEALVSKFGYTKCFEDEMYALYYSKAVDEGTNNKKALLIRYHVKDCIFYTLDTNDAFVIIGGDDCMDKGLLRAEIRSHNNHVDTWYLLNEEASEGEFFDICAKPEGAGIDNSKYLSEITDFRAEEIEALFDGDNKDYYINYLQPEDDSKFLLELGL